MVARSSSSVIPERYRVMICCFLVTRCGRGAALFTGCASLLNIQKSSTEIGHCRLVLRTANCPASLAGCSLAYQARLPCVELAAYILRTALRRRAGVHH